MYSPAPDRYDNKVFNRCGNSGLKLSAISLGLWHNFGDVTIYDNSRAMALRAFDLGITHFDLANNYGPPSGSAERNWGRILKDDLSAYRDELIISTKAGYTMWPGPYGDWGSRKYLISSLDQSLKRMGLEYVDIFYHHRPDPETPLEETMRALSDIVKSGKALYVGLSNYYNPELAQKAYQLLREMGTPCLIQQVKYNIFDRRVEQEGLLNLQEKEDIGVITFSPLEKGILTNRYLKDIPQDSRLASGSPFLKEQDINNDVLEKVRLLNDMASQRNQTLAQMALAWNLSKSSVCSVLIGTSKVSQVEDCVKATENTSFTEEELKKIEDIVR
ncbi:aldo/keto reductase [Spirochaeta cellobiosiphila]|uniref:aldo/keto reductase n=1 Tax=Spirochaeta cellobiosiphila TaxID=504483 RepID=UPI000409C257|nr:aldo/keto reductase [Spirochaeta cellobiosiphila]